MKKLLFPMMMMILFITCKKEIAPDLVSDEINGAAAKLGKIDVCHFSAETGTYHTINISANALPAHIAHGDIVPDADGDGYTKTNPCGNGSQDDCDDNNADINPGATEICGNGIDENCNGNSDDYCFVTICDQDWMVKNLDVTTYRNGDVIPQVTDPSAWAGLTTGAWCYYENVTANGTVYGKLYNWYAVNDSRGLAPEGWHVPSNAEWTTLTDCLGGNAVAGGKMKSTGTFEAGTGLWLSTNFNATNSSGFTGHPGGIRRANGTFALIRQNGFWWTSTSTATTTAWDRNLSYDVAAVNGIGTRDKRLGFSIRCVKD